MNSTHKNLLSILTLAGQFFSPALVSGSMASDNPVDAVVAGGNSFAVDLYQALLEDDNNLFFSPLSISTALSMTYAGAKNQTAAQMQEVLHLPANSQTLLEGNKVLRQLLETNLDQGSQMNLANSIWPDRSETLLDSFVESLKKNYGAEVQALDFKNNSELATEVINKWVEDKTKGRIVDLLQPGDINSDTRLVLANAIVFDGKWKKAFDPEKTISMPFHLANGDVVKVQGMVQTAVFPHANVDGVGVLEIPFGDETTSLLIAMPTGKTTLHELETSLSPGLINQWIAQMRPRELGLVLPRFEMDERVDLSEVLIQLGMEDAFTGSADFTGISANQGLFIGKVIHQATLKIHEEGAEAAAATAVLMKRLSMTEGFRVDRPFLFMIRHGETGSILFMGRMVNPEAS